MKTGTKCRLKYMPLNAKGEYVTLNMIDSDNVAYVSFIESTFEFPVPLSELEEIKEWPKTWEELGDMKGYILSAESVKQANPGFSHAGWETTFATQQQAESALAFAQLSQLHKQIVGDWVPDWSNKIHGKFVVEVCGGLHVIEMFSTKYHLAFKTREQAEFSQTHHRELWEKYWML